MISCTLTQTDEATLRQMFYQKADLARAAEADDTLEEAYLQYRKDIIYYVLDKLGPAIQARIRTWTARKYCEEADAQSLVYEHVVQAVDKFKPEKGNCKFSSFFWTLSNRSFSNFINATKRQKRNPNTLSAAEAEQGVGMRDRALVSLEELTAENTNASNLVATELIIDAEELDRDLNYQSLVTLIFKYCNEQQRTIVDLLQQNYTYQEIAGILNTTPATVSRQIQQLKKRLHDELKHIRHDI